MSFAINPLKTVRVVDPRVNFANEREYAVVSGGNQVSWKPFMSTSYSNGSFNFSAPPPNPGICVDPRVYISVPLTIDFAGVNTGGAGNLNLLIDGDDAFRAYPISSVCSTLTVRINNSAASINLSDVMPSLLRYNTGHNIREFNYSTCPCMQDYYQLYSDGAGTVRNPLASFGSNSWETCRGAFPLQNVTNGATNAHIEATISEPLFLSPFLFGKGSELRNGFIGVQTMDFQFTFANDLTRIWSHNTAHGSLFTPPVNGTGMVVNFKQPALLFNYISPKLLEPIPRSISYSYMVVDRFPTDNGVQYNPGDQIMVMSNNIQLNTIPRRIYIFARRSNANQTVYTTDTFASLINISINYNNYSGLLASASQHDLYNISKKNGCNLSFPEWCGNSPVAGLSNLYSGISGFFNGPAALGFPPFSPTGLVGSVLCLDWGIDIGLDDLHAPGEILNSQLQINATFVNINQTDLLVPYTFYIVTISEGIWTVENLNSIPQIGVLSKEDILNSKRSPMIDYKSTDTIYGGDFIGKMKDIGRKVLAGLKTAWPYIKDVAQVAATVAPLFLGLGDEERMEQNAIMNDEMRHGMYGDGVMMGGRKKKGGKMISRAELHRRLQ
jgi:major capsid protein